MTVAYLNPKPFIIIDAVTGASPGVSTLDTVDAQKLSDGCLAFVRSTRQLYVLTKSSTLAPVTDVVVAAQGDGNWLYLIGNGAAFQTVEFYLSNLGLASLTLTGVSNWIDITPVDSQFTLTGGVANWNFNSSTGFLTLVGLPGLYLVNAVATLAHGVASSQTSMGIDKNDAAAPATQLITRTTSPTPNTETYQMAITGIISMSQGDTLQVKFAGEAGALGITALLVTVTPAP